MFLIFFIHTVFAECICSIVQYRVSWWRQEPQSLSQAWKATELYHSWAEDIADLLVSVLAETVLILLVY